MAYNEKLGERISKALHKHGVEEKRMFGGVAFMLNGHMCCGVIKDNLMIRVGLDRYGELVANAHARPMDFAKSKAPKKAGSKPKTKKPATSKRSAAAKAVPVKRPRK